MEIDPNMGDNENEALRNLKIIRAPTFRGKKGESIIEFFPRIEKFMAMCDIEPHRRVQAIGLCLESHSLKHCYSLLEANSNIQYNDLKDAMIRRFDQGRFNLCTRAKETNGKQNQND